MVSIVVEDMFENVITVYLGRGETGLGITGAECGNHALNTNRRLGALSSFLFVL